MSRHFFFSRGALPVLVIVAVSSLALAGNTGNFRLEVVDEEGKPVEGAKVSVTDPANASFRMEATTNAEGRADLLGFVPRAYDFRVQKQGFQIYESNFMTSAGNRTDKKVTLNRLGAGAVVEKGAEGEARVVEKESDPAAVAYNEAARLYNEGRSGDAMAELEKSLTAKAGYVPALALKGILLGEEGRCEEAVPVLKQAHEADATQATALGSLVRCLDKLGKAEEAAGYKKLLESSSRPASDLYNDAVTSINAGDDAAAEPLLKRAVEQDPAFAPAQYQYGLVLFRRGDLPAAVERLETYLKLAPQGEFSADAKGLVSALKPQ